jgi:hypothetical protein
MPTLKSTKPAEEGRKVETPRTAEIMRHFELALRGQRSQAVFSHREAAENGIEALEAELAAAKEELESLKSAIATPEALCANILRGTIPRPDIRSLLHLHGGEALKCWDLNVALVERLGRMEEVLWSVAFPTFNEHGDRVCLVCGGRMPGHEEGCKIEELLGKNPEEALSAQGEADS